MSFVFDPKNSMEFLGGEMEVKCLDEDWTFRMLIKDFDFECFSDDTVGIETQWCAISKDQGISYLIHLNVEELRDYNHKDFELMDSGEKGSIKLIKVQTQEIFTFYPRVGNTLDPNIVHGFSEENFTAQKSKWETNFNR